MVAKTRALQSQGLARCGSLRRVERWGSEPLNLLKGATGRGENCLELVPPCARRTSEPKLRRRQRSGSLRRLRPGALQLYARACRVFRPLERVRRTPATLGSTHLPPITVGLCMRAPWGGASWHSGVSTKERTDWGEGGRLWRGAHSLPGEWQDL